MFKICDLCALEEHTRPGAPPSGYDSYGGGYPSNNAYGGRSDDQKPAYGWNVGNSGSQSGGRYSPAPGHNTGGYEPYGTGEVNHYGGRYSPATGYPESYGSGTYGGTAAPGYGYKPYVEGQQGNYGGGYGGGQFGGGQSSGYPEFGHGYASNIGGYGGGYKDEEYNLKRNQELGRVGFGSGFPGFIGRDMFLIN